MLGLPSIHSAVLLRAWLQQAPPRTGILVICHRTDALPAFNAAGVNLLV